ncbi:MAG: Arm DNA-binding domain-containing protein [Egibacteraceae bacterium]
MTRPRGTIRQRGSRFTVILDRGTDPVTGKRRRESHSGYRTRKEAERARTKLLRELDEGRYVDRSTVTVATYLRDEWLPARKPKSVQTGRGHRGQVGIGTWATYRNLCEAYIIPHLGHIRLQALAADDVDGLYDRLEENGGRRGEGIGAQDDLQHPPAATQSPD